MNLKELSVKAKWPVLLISGLMLVGNGCVETRVVRVPVYQSPPPVYQTPPPPSVPVEFPPPTANTPPSQQQPPQVEATVTQAPPPAQVEVAPMAPGPNFYWVPGYWSWQGRWVWVGGNWVVRPRPGAIWVGGHWARRPHGYVWVGGRWR